jgi:hypothetical protein
MTLRAAKELPITICFPDNRKSCVACCGLYNVPDATRDTLQALLHHRTVMFRQTPRSIPALLEYERVVRHREQLQPLDGMIHVCEFTGFVDRDLRTPGCMLHPSAPGNRGIDLRGLCHYGALACRTFFCPSWEILDERILRLVVGVVDDWHTYGLVVTDPEFVSTLVLLLEQRTGRSLDLSTLRHERCEDLLRQMLAWKAARPPGSDSTLRRNRYYLRPEPPSLAPRVRDLTTRLVEILSSTFEVELPVQPYTDFIMAAVEEFCRAYSHGTGGGNASRA